MGRSEVAARIRLAVKRQEFIASSVALPERNKSGFYSPKFISFGYGTPKTMVKSVRLKTQDVAGLRQRFAESRLALYRRLTGVSDEEDCGCDE